MSTPQGDKALGTVLLWCMAAAAVVGAVLLYLRLVYLFFVEIALYFFGFGCLVNGTIALLIYLYMLGSTMFWGSGPVESPEGAEPAFKQYFFHKAFMDLSAVLGGSFSLGSRFIAVTFRVVRSLVTNPATLGIALGMTTVESELLAMEDSPQFKWPALATWPLGLVLAGVALAGTVSAAVVYLIYGAVHVALVVGVCLLAIVAAGFFRVIEYGSMLWRRIFIACPHAGCYQRIPLPIYLCPQCGAEHRRLMPGVYGTFARRCRCGHRLPTLFLFGRNRLPAICPHETCRRPLNSALGTVRNLHVPVVGGPSSGKSSFMTANVVELAALRDAGRLVLTFPEEQHERQFAACREAFLTGTAMQKTSEYSPDAFVMRVRSAGSREALVYFYDPAGELFQGSDELRNQQYYSYTHGIFFLVDPFSLDQVRARLARDLGAAYEDVRPCDERPQDVYDRLITTLREFSRMGGNLRSVPVAVVVTKADAFGLEASVAAFTPAVDPKNPVADPASAAVAAWLEAHGEGNLVRSLRQDFKQVRFFTCSALGRSPDEEGRPFVPHGVTAPLAWVLGRSGLDVDPGGSS